MGSAIDKYCYISCRGLPPFFEHKHRIVYSKIENVGRIDEIQHPSVREVLKYVKEDGRYFGNETGFEIHHDGDIPARSGMGSSSSFTVGLLIALYAMAGKVISKEKLCKEAIHIEQNLIKENVGSQDQAWAAYGGFNLINFLQNGEIIVSPIIMRENDLRKFQQNLVLFYTGISRYASEIAGDKIKNLKKKKSELFQMIELVDEAYAILTSGGDDFTEFGKLLNEAWHLKKSLSDRVSTSEIDELYTLALRNGAVGGKLLGAGGGGFILFYAEPENHPKLRNALRGYLQVPFDFDFSGSEIIVYRPDHLY